EDLLIAGWFRLSVMPTPVVPVPEDDEATPSRVCRAPWHGGRPCGGSERQASVTASAVAPGPHHKLNSPSTLVIIKGSGLLFVSRFSLLLHLGQPARPTALLPSLRSQSAPFHLLTKQPLAPGEDPEPVAEDALGEGRHLHVARRPGRPGALLFADEDGAGREILVVDADPQQFTPAGTGVGRGAKKRVHPGLGRVAAHVLEQLLDFL